MDTGDEGSPPFIVESDVLGSRLDTHDVAPRQSASIVCWMRPENTEQPARSSADARTMRQIRALVTSPTHEQPHHRRHQCDENQQFQRANVEHGQTLGAAAVSRTGTRRSARISADPHRSRHRGRPTPARAAGRRPHSGRRSHGCITDDCSVGEQAERLDRGDWYLDDAELRARRDACWRLLDQYNSTGPDDDQVRVHLLRATLNEVGYGVVVMPRFQCSYGRNITIAKGAFINSNAFLMDDAAIDIGANARLGPGAQLMTALHPVDDHSKRRDGWERALPISLGENVWLGAGVIVGAGVSIGRDSVIGAGSVVLHDLPERVVAAGAPARVIRSTFA